ncbi:hypothetical protein EYC98_02590 [Halieaceae bacterium IMCC14734]|uniref:TubC N-terminal docking domain-containing protein n=1 Tax=Candidatus Litorirhabdus singularis TaxID=2518993 RepID=A0ABT3TBU2_9GAMM|nr:hypothetical protein [Candidatus Litorirhabdus singularis]MCX2979747.1 hypothetical protein [Candidatus Litorirhabdus singularis]
MDVTSIVYKLRAEGVRLFPRGDKLLAVPQGNAITDEQRALIKANRETLLAEVSKTWQPAQVIDFLTGCEIVPEDARFILDHLPTDRRARIATLNNYRAVWIDASTNEPVPHKKENAGRLAANTWLRTVCRGSDCG